MWKARGQFETFFQCVWMLFLKIRKFTGLATLGMYVHTTELNRLALWKITSLYLSDWTNPLNLLQIEHLSGRNEELRHELHNAREETAKAIMQVERKNTKVQYSVVLYFPQRVSEIPN